MFYSKPWANLIWRSTVRVWVTPVDELWKRTLGGERRQLSVRQTSTMQSFIEGLPAPPPCICRGPTSISFHWNWVRSRHASLTCCSHRDLAFLDLAKWLLPQGPYIAFSLLGKFFLQVSFQLTLPCLYCLWCSVWPNQPNLFLFVCCFSC